MSISCLCLLNQPLGQPFKNHRPGKIVAVGENPRPAHAKAAAARAPVRPEPKARAPEPSDDEAVARYSIVLVYLPTFTIEIHHSCR